MVTREQALTCNRFRQIAKLNGEIKIKPGSMNRVFVSDGTSTPLDTPINWRANGRCKTWTRSPERFQLPIKHGLYNYGYITNDNAHLFEVEQ